MSQFEFNVKDYRIIKEADFSPSDISLLYAKNGYGKSTMLKAIVSLLSNRHLDDNFRHGKDSYSISARVDGTRLTYTRNGSTSQLQFNDEASRSKLGMGSMASVEPRFPLKRVDFEEDSFYPNFCFQNDVPIFGQIDATQLFSIMFADVAKVSGRVTQLKRDCGNLSKTKNDSQVNGDMLKGKVSEAKKDYDTLKAQFPDLDERYKELGALVKRRDDCVAFQAEFSEISEKCGDGTKRDLVSLYQEAQPLFSKLVFVQKVQGLLDQYGKLIDSLTPLQMELDPLVELFPTDLVGLFDGVVKSCTLTESGIRVEGELNSLPDVSYELITSVSGLMSVLHTFSTVSKELLGLPDISVSLLDGVNTIDTLVSELVRLGDAVVDVNHEYYMVMEELKAFPCDRVVNGTCPYGDQIRV